MRIETNIGGALLKLANNMQNADISATQIIQVLTPVLRSSGEDLKDADVKRIVWEAGIAEGLRAVAEVIAFIISGGEEVSEGNDLEAVNG